jgi:hypothetical protein
MNLEKISTDYVFFRMLTNKDETRLKYNISALIEENGKNKYLKLCKSILISHGLLLF